MVRLILSDARVDPTARHKSLLKYTPLNENKRKIALLLLKVAIFFESEFLFHVRIQDLIG